MKIISIFVEIFYMWNIYIDLASLGQKFAFFTTDEIFLALRVKFTFDVQYNNYKVGFKNCDR